MLRTLGAAMIVIACLLMGLRSGERMKSRLRFLSSLCGQLELMRVGVCTELRPITQVLRQLSEDRRESSAALFFDCLSALENGGGTLREAWQNAAEGCERFGLTGEDILEISLLGDYLGRFGAEEQEPAFRRLERGLERREQALRSELGNAYRLRAVIGAGAGVSLLILMI